jgi:hypothetical protein
MPSKNLAHAGIPSLKSPVDELYRQVAMRKRVFILALLLIPLVARANPVEIDGQSLIAFSIVAFWALVIESGIVTLALVSCGVLIVPAFITLVLANVAVFLFAFLPLTGRVPLWILEPGVVLVDAVFVKFVTSISFIQGGGFLGVSWRRALVASLIGNTASFFVGVIASGAPWIVHEKIQSGY